LSAASAHGQAAFRGQARERRIALFGGTFDPIHTGHLAVARAAERRFQLHEVQFIPTARPPHKRSHAMAPFAERYAMVALACADHPRFIASLAESGGDHSGGEVSYSVDTVRRMRRQLRGSGTHLFFLMGADSFLDIQTWKDYETLLGLCDFIVASRPGFGVEALREVVPAKLLAPLGAAPTAPGSRAIALRRTTIFVLDSVSSHVSATEVRGRLDRGQPIHGLVPPRVEEYITKQALYRCR
jgi:nicotinate-nucleotide adenylyltransferase